jgi:PAS domain S-box-containing protein
MRFGPLRVLHADDQPDLHPLVEAHLRRDRPDATVERVESADAALDALAESGYDCVISDYDMPGSDGLELLDSVRETHPDLPFVLFTGKGSEEIASEAISAGVTDYVQKGDPSQFRVLANRVTDAVESYRTAAALAENKRRLRTLISNLPGLVYRARPEDPWRMTFVDGRAEEVTGYPAEAFERGEVTFGSDLIHPEDRGDVDDAVSGAIETNDTFEVTYRIRTESGTLRHVWEQGEAVVEDGEPVALEGFVMDITDRRERERRLRRQNERLDEFASTVSHDLRNPLNVATGRLSMVDSGDPNVEKAKRALERMNLLIDDLLALARDGRAVEDPQPVELAPLVRECWRAVGDAGATLRVETERTVSGERGQLRRALENLLRNAVEHGSTNGRASPDDAVERPTSEGDAEHGPADGRGAADGDGVTVTVGDLDDGTGFFVADDGPGIAESEREAVFERGHTTQRGGTGFGLTIVERIAAAHGWDVVVTESESGGARFEFRGVS